MRSEIYRVNAGTVKFWKSFGETMMKAGKRRIPAVATTGAIQKIMRTGGRKFNPNDPTDAEALTALRRMEVVNARNGALSPNSLRRLAK